MEKRLISGLYVGMGRAGLGLLVTSGSGEATKVTSESCGLRSDVRRFLLPQRGTSGVSKRMLASTE